ILWKVDDYLRDQMCPECGAVGDWLAQEIINKVVIVYCDDCSRHRIDIPLSKLSSLTAEAKVASEDYPELTEILEERPPLPHSEPLGGTQAMQMEAGYVVLDDAGEIVAGPFTSRQDAAEAEALMRED